MLRNFKNLILILMIPAIILGCNNTSPRQYTVGIVNLNGNLDRVITAFKHEMHRYGYVEHENITYLYNGALKNTGQIDAEVSAMLDAEVDLLVTLTTPVTKKAKQLTQTSQTPILFAPVFSPVSTGLVDSMAHPGGNITGIKTRGSTAKALEWFLKITPTAKRILVPFHYTDKAAIQTVADLQEAARFFNIELIIQKIATEQELNTVLAQIPTDIDAIWLIHSHLIISHVKEIVTAATLRKKPVISSTDQSKAGVMVCYAMSQEKIGQHASRMADKILKGTSPAIIPVETADYFLGLNLKTAKALNIKIPNDVISQAKSITR